MAYHYATENIEGAKAVVRNVSASTKQSVEIANSLRGQSTDAAKRILNGIISMKTPVRFTRFNWNVGHRPGIGPGRFPQKAAREFLTLVKSVEANAKNLGMDATKLYIKSIVVQKGSARPRYGRHRGRMTKNTSIEMVAAPMAEAEKAPAKKAAPKKEAKASTN